MNSGNKNEWAKYKELVEKLDRSKKAYKSLGNKLKTGLNNVKNMRKTASGDEVPNELDEEIANTILEIEDELLKIRKEQIKKGTKYGNLIDTKKFVCFIEKNDTEKINRHIRDHFDTLVRQRNAILSKSLNINPYIGIAGLIIQGATIGAACVVIIVGGYLMVKD